VTASPAYATAQPVRFPNRRADRSYLRTPAVLFAIPCAVLAQLFLSANTTTPNYALAQAAAVTATMAIVGPIVALCAAWEAFTLRSLWGRLTVSRSWWRVLVQRLTPVLAVGVLVQAMLYVVALLQLPDPAWPGWQLPFLSLLGVVAWTFFGAATALVLGRLLAMTVALLVPYLALTLPAGWQPFWLRHVNGSPFDCCSTSDVLDPRVTIGSAGVLGTILLLSLCVARVRLAPSQHRPWLAAAVAVAALIAGGACVSAATGLGAMPTKPRSADALVCREDVCLWPEDGEALAANRDGWAAVREAWRGLGLTVPENARIAPVSAGGRLALTTTATDVDSAKTTMAQLLPRALTGCLGDFDDPARNDKFDRLSVLLASRLTFADPEARAVTVPDPQPVPADAESLWRAVGRCGS